MGAGQWSTMPHCMLHLPEAQLEQVGMSCSAFSQADQASCRVVGNACRISNITVNEFESCRTRTGASSLEIHKCCQDNQFCGSEKQLSRR